MSYAEEIIQKGAETLEKFLFLLKEDIILFEDREQREKNEFKNGEAEIILDKFQKWIKKNERNEEIFLSNQDYLDIRKTMGSFTNSSKSQYLASNAHFVYLFALFDQFILEIAKLSLKNDLSLMENYTSYCVNYFGSGLDKNLYKLLPYDNELIDYFSKFPSPIKVITKILGIPVVVFTGTFLLRRVLLLLLLRLFLIFVGTTLPLCLILVKVKVFLTLFKICYHKGTDTIDAQIFFVSVLLYLELVF